jgi:hypothetical protein
MSKHVGVKSIQGNTVVIYTVMILIVHLLVITKNNKRCTVHGIKIFKKIVYTCIHTETNI